MLVNGFGAEIILYMILPHMFAGLAIICDEYFVPSLEVIAEKLDVLTTSLARRHGCRWLGSRAIYIDHWRIFC